MDARHRDQGIPATRALPLKRTRQRDVHQGREEEYAGRTLPPRRTLGGQGETELPTRGVAGDDDSGGIDTPGGQPVEGRRDVVGRRREAVRGREPVVAGENGPGRSHRQPRRDRPMGPGGRDRVAAAVDIEDRPVSYDRPVIGTTCSEPVTPDDPLAHHLDATGCLCPDRNDDRGRMRQTPPVGEGAQGAPGDPDDEGRVRDELDDGAHRPLHHQGAGSGLPGHLGPASLRAHALRLAADRIPGQVLTQPPNVSR